jgi:hypothetical protein
MHAQLPWQPLPLTHTRHVEQAVCPGYHAQSYLLPFGVKKHDRGIVDGTDELLQNDQSGGARARDGGTTYKS